MHKGTKQYYTIETLDGVWLIVSPEGRFIYRDETLYKGNPPLLTFHDEDEAKLHVERCNWTLKEDSDD